MTNVELRPHLDEQMIGATVARMLAANDWRLIDADELARLVALALASPPPTPAGDGPADEEQPAPSRPWRRQRSADPVEAAALRLYSEQLYRAFANQQGEERQQRAYFELLRYARRVAARCGPELSVDDREEVAAEALGELFRRYVAGAVAPSRPVQETAGSFMAVTLQLVRNIVRVMRRKSGPLVPLDVPAFDHANGAQRGPDHPQSSADPVGHAERRELSGQIVRAFQLATERYPRARLQLRVVWHTIVEKLSDPTIASRLGLSLGHVRTLRCRGLARLQNDPDFRIHAQDEGLLGGERPSRKARPAAQQERELGDV